MRAGRWREHAGGSIVLAIALVSLVACGKPGPPPVVEPASSTPTTFVANGPPQISGFRADPAVISPGQNAVLLWTVDDIGATLSIDQGIGPVTGTSFVVTPGQTTAYTLTATNANGAVTAQTTITVGAGGSGTATKGSLPFEGNGSWENVTGNLAGHPSVCGSLGIVSARPDVDVMLASVALHGMFANTDASTPQWDALGTGAGSAQIINGVSSVLYDPQHPGTWWQTGNYYGGGVYTTTDGGTTFQQLGDISRIDLIGVDFTDPERKTMLAGRHELTEVELSTDGGATWAPLPNLPPDIGYTSAPFVVDAATWLLGTPNGGAPGVYRTTDAGATWTQVQEGPIDGNPLLVADGTIYWVVGGDLVATTDGGATWTTRASRRLDLGALVEVGPGLLGGVAGSKIAVSADGGVTWEQVGADLPYAPTGLAYSVPRQAFYIWHSDCRFDDSGDPVLPDAIIREVIT